MKQIFLLIDLDDTLFDAESAYAHALNSVGIDPFCPDYSEARKTIKSRLGEGHVGARNRILYFKQMLDSTSKYSHCGVLELMERYEKHLSEHIEAQWCSLGRKRLFQGRLGEIPKVIVTNENLRTQMIKLKAIDPEGKLFPRLVTSEEMGVEKPSHSLFEQAAKVLGVEPKDCIMVGDSFENDIVPAMQLGMRPFLTTEFRKSKKGFMPPRGVGILSKLEDLENNL